MAKSKKKGRKDERRVLLGAIVVAGVITAGSTFAWFTSTDEVTNRLSANADYDVKIVESFAPPENWLPGQDVDKDVYAVNTGNIPAYAKATVSGVMSVTREKAVSFSTVFTAGTPATTQPMVCHWAHGSLLTNGYDAWVNTNEIPNDALDVPASLGAFDGQNGQMTPPADATKYKSDGASGYYFYKEEPVAAVDGSWNDSNVYNCVELNAKERYAIEAGAYLAYKPAGDSANKLGNQVVAFQEETYTGEDPTNNGKTDFTPRADGLYVFRRSIVVNNTDSTDGTGLGTESFKYEGYCYFGGKYYKITNLEVTPDGTPDVAGDEVFTDGNLSNATADLVQEVREVLTPTLTYDNANHRLIATVANDSTSHFTGDLVALAQAVDEAEHNLAEAEVALRAALHEAGIEDANVNTLTDARDRAKADYDAAKAAYDKAVAEYNELLGKYQSGKNALTSAKTAAQDAFEDLVGADGKIKFNTAPTAIEEDGTGVTLDTTAKTVAAGGAIATYEDNSTAAKYAAALDAYNTFKTEHTTDLDHIYRAYLQELYNNDASGYKTGAAADGHDVPDWVKTDNEITPAPTSAAIAAEVAYASTKVTYDYAKNHVAYSDTNEAHQFHELAMKLKIATEDYQKGLQACYNAMTALNNAVTALGANGAFQPIDLTVANEESAITSLKATDSATYKALSDKYKELTGSAPADEAAAMAYDSTTYKTQTGGLARALKDAEDALTAAQAALDDVTNQIVDTNNDNVSGNLKQAQEDYQKAKNALALAEQRLAAAQKGHDADGDIVIYINLQNDVLTATEKGKWQVLPTVVDDNQAVFYYTGILGAGDVSKQLIDSVKLADSVTQDMFKYFDFDLNVKLESAQVTYDDNNYITVEAANTEFDWDGSIKTNGDPTYHNVTGQVDSTTATSDTIKDVVVSWSETDTDYHNP